MQSGDNHPSQSRPSVLVLGIGNILWADEGFGVRAADHLHRHWAFDDSVTVMDGGTQGIYLLEHIERADILVILDAIDYGLDPGTMKLIEDEAVPSYLGAKKVSLHQTGFQEVLAMADMLGRMPERILLVGVQPRQIEDFGGSLHPMIRDCVEPAASAAVVWLRKLGVQAVRRAQPLGPEDSIAGSEIDQQRYERERPTAADACRIGDERVLDSERYRVAYRPVSVDPGSVSVDVDHRGKY